MVRLDGVNDFLATAGQSYAAKTLIALFAKNTVTFSDYNGIATMRTGSASYKVAPSNEDNGMTGRPSSNTITGFGTASGAYLDGAAVNLTADNNYTVGVDLGSATAFHPLTHQRSGSMAGAKYWVIGADTYSAGRFLTRDIAEIIVYDSVLTAATRQSVETCLAQKYGLGH